MYNMDIYNVRYYLGPATLKTNNSAPYRTLVEVLKHLSDLLPFYMIDDEVGDLWLYCCVPIRDELKRIICELTGGYFPLFKEFEV